MKSVLPTIPTDAVLSEKGMDHIHALFLLNECMRMLFPSLPTFSVSVK